MKPSRIGNSFCLKIHNNEFTEKVQLGEDLFKKSVCRKCKNILEEAGLELETEM